MNRYVRPIMFAFEPDVVFVYAMVTFGASGAPTLNTNYSKGLCNISRSTVSFTANTASSSGTITAVSSYLQLFTGMTVTGTGIPASTTISSLSPASFSAGISNNASATNTGTTLTAAGGQFTITFGSQYSPARFDPYVRLLNWGYSWDETGLPGTALVAAGSPAAPAAFLVKNNISNYQLANLVLQTGTLSDATFTAKDPGNGDILRLSFMFTRSTAI